MTWTFQVFKLFTIVHGRPWLETWTPMLCCNLRKQRRSLFSSFRSLVGQVCTCRVCCWMAKALVICSCRFSVTSSHDSLSHLTKSNRRSAAERRPSLVQRSGISPKCSSNLDLIIFDHFPQASIGHSTEICAIFRGVQAMAFFGLGWNSRKPINNSARCTVCHNFMGGFTDKFHIIFGDFTRYFFWRFHFSRQNPNPILLLVASLIGRSLVYDQLKLLCFPHTPSEFRAGERKKFIQNGCVI